MRRVAVGVVLAFIGLAVIEQSVPVGLGITVAGIALIAVPTWLKSATAIKPIAVQQHTEHANARRETEELRYRAEYEAGRIVSAASKKAEKRKSAAIKAAREHVASEPRWVG